MTFYLQDVTGGKSLTSDYTLATLVVNLQMSTAKGAVPRHFGGGASGWAAGTAIVLIGLSLAWAWMAPRRKRLLLALGGAVFLASLIVSFAPTKANGQSQPLTAQQSAAALDRMIAAHKDQEQLAQYVFNTHGCKSCHVLGQNGKLGFTTRGQQVGKDFEGCIRLLTDMNQIVEVPDTRRSGQERHKAARFQEFGCTFCHNVGTDKVGMTELGAKLSNLHLGCVDIEKQLANGPPPRR
jgi:cytochrome c551/c552